MRVVVVLTTRSPAAASSSPSRNSAVVLPPAPLNTTTSPCRTPSASAKLCTAPLPSQMPANGGSGEHRFQHAAADCQRFVGYCEAGGAQRTRNHLADRRGGPHRKPHGR